MENIPIKITAKNSSGEHTLHLTEDEGEFWFTLTGEHEGKAIQIDFEHSTRSELEEIQTAIELILQSV